jgi:outer membrane lipase/esterase
VGGHTAIFHLPQQIDEYFEDLSGGSPSKDTIFSVWAGGNDMLREHHSNLQVPIDAADAVQEQVQRLIDEGARQFVIPDMVPLGLMPAFNAFPLTSNARNAQAAAFVDRLKENVATLRANNRGVKISMIPVTTLVHSMVKYASCYGLMNVTDQFVNASAGEDPDEYLWWNGVHMTEVGHEIMGNFAADVLLGNIRAVLPLASTLFAGTPEERREFLRRARQRYGSCIYAWGLDLPVADLLQTR